MPLSKQNTLKARLVNFLKEQVKYYKTDGVGCSTFKLDDTIAVCVGWLDGYDVCDTEMIHSKSEPTFCVNAGIKVWTSDSLRTDYDWINSPYFEDGSVWDTGVTISRNENYEALADYFLKEYESMLKYDIAHDGKILGLAADELVVA